MIHKLSLVDPKAKILNDVKIGPFCYVGPNVILNENVELVSNVHIEGNTNIGNNVKIGGGSGVVKNIKDNQIVMGYPAVPLKNFIKNNKIIKDE